MRKRRRGGEVVFEKYSVTEYCSVLSGGGGEERESSPPDCCLSRSDWQ